MMWPQLTLKGERFVPLVRQKEDVGEMDSFEQRARPHCIESSAITNDCSNHIPW